MKRIEKKLPITAQTLKPKTILVIGDVMLDEFLWCKVDRISPEAPVPICRVQETTRAPGGAGNVATNIQALGSTAKLVGLIGRDIQARRLIAELGARGVSTDYLIENKDHTTILKTRIIAHHQHVVRVDHENNSPVSPNTESQVLDLVRRELASCQLVLISDYQKGLISESLLTAIIAKASEQKKRVVIDPKGEAYSKYEGAYLLTPNFSEFQRAVKKTLHTEQEIQEEGLKLIETLKLAALVITRSEKGITILTRSGEKKDIPAKAQEVFDITGAGDTAISMLSIALANDLPLTQAAEMANYAAGVVVGKMGTASATLAEIKTAMTHAN